MREKHGFSLLLSIGMSLIMPVMQAQAEETAPSCPAAPAPPPTELAAWPSRAGMAASVVPPAVDGARLVIGKAVDLTLHPAAAVHYAMTPNKADEPAEFGGMLWFDIDKAGVYRVALGSGAWIDVLAGATAVTSIAHARGPACSGIRKMVDFQLPAGRYMLQISAARAPMVPVMIARLR